MRKNLITAKTQKSTQGQTKMAKPLHGIMNKQSLFRGAAPQGEFTNISKTATTNMAINPAQFYSPELTPETWLLPKSRLEILKWCRIYFNLDPYIQSILTMHAQYPISTFRLQYKDKDTEDFFNRKLFEDCQIDWVSFLERLSLSYYVYGEAICLTGDTKIKLLNGTSRTLKDLYDKKESNFWVYSLDEKGNIVPGKADKVILTQKNAEVLKITLDSGEYFKCTPNHLCLLRNGVYVEAKNLKPGNTLMPLYTKMDHVRGKQGSSKYTYEMVYNPGLAEKQGEKTGEWKFTHRLVAKYTYGNPKKDTIIHHKNFNKEDNTPENLQPMSQKEHMQIHNNPERNLASKIRMEELYKDPERSEERKRLCREGLSKPEVREKISQASKKFWSNPDNKEEARKRSLGRKVNIETKKKLSNSAKEIYLKNPEDIMQRLQRATIAATKSNKGRKFSVERRKLQSINAKKAYSTPEGREKQRARIKAYWDRKKAEQQSLKEYKNHKVVSVECVPNEDVFDIHSVDKFHNFALEVGVFVHNCWGDWNSVKGTWNDIILIDPALIDYQEDALTGKSVMSLIPTQELKQLVAQALRDGSTNLPADYIACVQDNKQIPLDTEGVEPNYLTGRKYVPPTAFIFARLLSPGSTRGVPIIQQLFKTLIYADKIRLAQVAAADSFYNPIQLWSIGSYTGDPKTSIIPTEADLQQYRDMIEQATMTPPFSIYVPPFVKYEALGVQGKLLSVYEDLGYVENCIFVGLGVNKNLVLGSGPSFSSGKQISLYRLIKMYKSFRLKLEAFFKKYVILPIAKAADIRDEHSNYIIPEIKWSESLQPEQDKDLFDSLFKLYDKGLVSTQTLMEHFMIPLDMKLEQQRMEAEKRTIFDKGTDRLGAKVLREDLQNLDKSKMGGGSSSGPKSEPLAGGSSGGLGGGEEKLDLGKPYPGSAGSDKSYLPPPISGGAGVDKGETPAPSNEAPTEPEV